MHFCTPPPGSLPPRTRSVRTPREADRSPPWRPVITGPGWAQPREPRKQAFCETRHRARSQRQREPVGPESPSGGIFLSTCVQPITAAGWTHTWADWNAEPATRPEDHLRSWTVKTQVSAGLSCGLTSGHRPSNQSENSLETRQSPGLAHGRGLGRADRRLVSITTGARRGSPCGPKLCRPLTPPGPPGS